jgi:hypothetical protein
MDQFLNLTPKQALFCDEFFKDFNATDAALRAGYSAATALSGYLMTLPKIKCHLQQRGAEAAEKAQVTHAMLLAELKTVGFARMSAFFGSDGKPKAMNEVDEETKAALLNYTVTEDKHGTTTVKIRMNNKLSALDKLAKHLKFYDAQYPAHSAMYYVMDSPTLDKHDRFDDDSFAKKEAEKEAEMDKRVAEAVAAAEERMKAEFELKLKKVKKAAKKKRKNTEEYPRGGGLEQGVRSKEQGQVVGLEEGASGEKQEARSRNQEEGSRMSEDGSQNGEYTQEYPRVAGQVVGDNTKNGGVTAEVKVIGDREGQYTEDGYLIRHDNPNRDKNCPYYSPYSGLYILKKMGSMVVKSYLPSNSKSWSRKETHPDGAPLVDPLCDKSQRG